MLNQQLEGQLWSKHEQNKETKQTDIHTHRQTKEKTRQPVSYNSNISISAITPTIVR
jgi:hypothetical protein